MYLSFDCGCKETGDVGTHFWSALTFVGGTKLFGTKKSFGANKNNGAKTFYRAKMKYGENFGDRFRETAKILKFDI